MAAVVLLRASSRVSLIRAASLPAARNVSAGRLYYLTSDKRTFSNSTRTLEPVKELSVPEKSEPKTAGVEGPHRHDHTPTPTPTPAPTGLVPPPSLSTHTTGDWVLFHPVYTKEELNSVQVLQHERKTMSDKAAAWFVHTLRKGFDLVSGYKHKDLPPNHESMSVADLRAGGYIMDPGQWLMRILFLETIAGVPGFTAAMIRHLRSLRIMRRDGGWIHMLLEEAENERMHLMTFMTLKEPSIWFRALILGAQGVFANAFFFSYLISPKTCHRFVGVLEEEATYTYTHLINDMEAGRVPEWSSMPAPPIAIDYWRLRPDATLLDVIYAVRSDETTHRFVNHTLANLNPKDDVNPFALGEPNMLVKGVKAGFSREEAAQYMMDNRKKAKDAGLDQAGTIM